MRVFIPDVEASERMGLAERLGSRRDFEIRTGTSFAASSESISASIDDAEAICVALGSVSADAMAAAPQLRLIVKCGIGLDNIDLGAAAQRGIAVARTSSVNSSGPAEWVIGAVISHMRRMASLDRAVRAGAWTDVRAHWAGLLPALSGRTLGIVGFGAVGRRLGELGTAHGMKVLAHDPFIPADVRPRVQLVGRDHVLSIADVLSLNLVLTDETEHWLSREALRMMKPSAIIANSSRGRIVDEPALIDALRRGTIAGAVLDVLELEPPDADNPLFLMDNVLLAPHLGGCTDYGYQEIGARALEILEQFSRGEGLPAGSVVIPAPAA